MLSRFSLVFALVLSMGAVGCGGGGDDSPDGDGDSTAQGGGDKGGGGGDEPGGRAAKPKGYSPVSIEPFPEIEITVTKREQPKTIAEAYAAIKEMKAETENNLVPEVLQYPFTREKAIGYAESMAFLRAQRAENMAWLKKLDPNAVEIEMPTDPENLENRRKGELDRLEKYLQRDIDFSIKYSRENIVGSVDSHTGDMERGANLSLDNDAHLKNQLADPQAVERRAKVTRDALLLIEIGSALDESLGVDDVDWAAKKKTLEGHANAFFGMVEKAADSIKPPADIGKPELAEIAKGVLAANDFAYERLIVNSDKRSQNETSFHYDDGSIYKVVRRWDEFQVATIEKEGDGYSLWYNEMLYYTEGPKTVPKGKWVLGARFRSSTILEKNIGE